MYTIYRHVLKVQWSRIYTLTALENQIFSFSSVEQYNIYVLLSRDIHPCIVRIIVNSYIRQKCLMGIIHYTVF